MHVHDMEWDIHEVMKFDLRVNIARPSQNTKIQEVYFLV
jgi:hypothetical protein